MHEQLGAQAAAIFPAGAVPCRHEPHLFLKACQSTRSYFLSLFAARQLFVHARSVVLYAYRLILLV